MMSKIRLTGFSKFIIFLLVSLISSVLLGWYIIAAFIIIFIPLLIFYISLTYLIGGDIATLFYKKVKK